MGECPTADTRTLGTSETGWIAWADYPPYDLDPEGVEPTGITPPDVTLLNDGSGWFTWTDVPDGCYYLTIAPAYPSTKPNRVSPVFGVKDGFPVEDLHQRYDWNE
jgi:hypothetical protein